VTRLALYALATVLLAAALACYRKLDRSRTLEDAAPWLALLAAAVLGSAMAALFAGGAR
jgi:uncharacterized membrane protein